MFAVHKLVLSTCSEYFEKIFAQTDSSKHAVIVLKDVQQSELEALLNYMYIGEVNVLQSDLAGLIKAAECLRIKGLAAPDDQDVIHRRKSGDDTDRGCESKRTSATSRVSEGGATSRVSEGGASSRVSEGGATSRVSEAGATSRVSDVSFRTSSKRQSSSGSNNNSKSASSSPPNKKMRVDEKSSNRSKHSSPVHRSNYSCSERRPWQDAGERSSPGGELSSQEVSDVLVLGRR